MTYNVSCPYSPGKKVIMKLTTALRNITIAASAATIALVPLAGAQAHAAPAADASAHATSTDPGYSGYTPEEAAFLKTVEVKGSPGGVPPTPHPCTPQPTPARTPRVPMTLAANPRKDRTP